MGRFRAEKIIIRKVNDLTIIFYDANSIYVFPNKGPGTIFHRWWAPRGSYRDGWGNFRQYLMREKNITLLHCFELAAERDIQSVSTTRWPKITRPILELTDKAIEKENEP